MEYFLFQQFEKCLQCLDFTDVVGVNWHLDPVPHFNGNFWWSTGKYFLSLPDTIGDDYFDPEFYIGLHNPIVYNLFESSVFNIHHYYNTFPPGYYVDLD